MSTILNWLRRRSLGPNGPQDEGEEEELPREVTTVPVKDLVEITSVPRDLLSRIWGLAEIDLPLSHLTEHDIKWLQWRIEIIARGSDVLEPEEPHPVFMKILQKYRKRDIDIENVGLWGYVRARRAIYGHERKLTSGFRPREVYH